MIDALAREGLVVILDNHVSHAEWCCSNDDGNGLWYTGAYPESSWIGDWRGMVRRYKRQPAVVGADLRNELRSDGWKIAVWGGPIGALDWRAAAERGGNAVLDENPNLLVVVEGLMYAAALNPVFWDPVRLKGSAPSRVLRARLWVLRVARRR